MEQFLIFGYYGIIAGAIYLSGCFLRRLFKFNLFFTIPLDIITGFIIGLIFFNCLIKHAFGEMRLILVLGFFVGLIITIITFKNFVATISNFVYNRINKLLTRVKHLTKRRKANDGGEINQDC